MTPHPFHEDPPEGRDELRESLRVVAAVTFGILLLFGPVAYPDALPMLAHWASVAATYLLGVQ